MNMLLKQKLKTIADNIKDVDYQRELTAEKVELQKQYIDDVKKNKDKLIEEKVSLIGGNEEEIFSRKADIKKFQQDNDNLLI